MAPESLAQARIPRPRPALAPCAQLAPRTDRREPDARNAGLRALARRALLEPAPGQAMGQLLGELLPAVERALQRLARRSDARPDRDAARARVDGWTARFLEAKLLDPQRAFLRRLAEALHPLAYACQSARNLALDACRARGPGLEVELPVSLEDPRPMGGGTWEERLSAQERFARLWGRVLELAPADRLLLELAFLPADELTGWALERLAGLHDLTPAQAFSRVARLRGRDERGAPCRPDLPRLGYAELARLIGLLAPGASEAEAARVSNTLNQRLRRIVRRLRDEGRTVIVGRGE